MNKMRNYLKKQHMGFVIAALLFFTISISNLHAGTTGKIVGVVKNAADNEILPGANIIIRAQIVNEKEQPLSPLLGAAANLNGEYFILNVRPGRYVIECSVIGYQKMVKTGVSVSVDRTTTLNFILSEQIIEGEEVVVTAERPLVVKDLTSTSAKVAGETIKDLPVESFEEVITLQSGITKGMTGGLHIRGGRSSEIKYYVDGIAISNPFNNTLAVPVENNAIQELEVISGTFNAEYGQAQSGIVNIVTKEGTDKFTGSLSAYFGDFYSKNTDIFWNIDDVNPMSQKYFEGSISGPVFTNKLKFFLSGRYTDHQNWLYGKQIFLPQDSASFAATDRDEWYIESTGDSQYVSMNPGKSLSGQFKLTYQLFPSVKLSYNLMANNSEGKPFHGAYRLNPNSRTTNYTAAYNHLFNLTHTVNPRVFYTLKFASYENDYKSYVHEDPTHQEYTAAFGRNRQPGNVFSTGGIDARHVYKNSQTFALRGDLNMQVDKYNFIKIGAEYRDHRLNLENYNIDVDPFVYGDWERRIPPLTSTEHNKYNNNPVEFSAYIQDKIEIKDLIVNVGVRFDYFDANSRIPVDLRDPANKLFPEAEEDAYEQVKAKTQISPRLGLAFPITDQGVIHAAYGQFFQIPEFERLYENPEFEVFGFGNSFIGNADLDAQRTDTYELGLQQQLAEFLAVDITGFYRNVRNLMGSVIYQTYRTDVLYGRYANNSHGSVRGVTFAVKVRVPQLGVTADVNYTYQTAKGVASDPKQEFYDAAGRNESTIVLNPLDWDLRHTLNAFLNYSQKNWGASIIAKLNSGYPFTPGGYVELRNAGRYKGDFGVDLNAYKRFDIGNLQVELFAKVINVFDKTRVDQLPEVRPVDEEAHAANGLDLFNTLYEYRLNPTLQPVPREFRVGTKFIF